MKILSLFDGEWKPVANYEGFYEVNRNGDVRRVGKEKLIHRKQEANGYIRVRLSKHKEKPISQWDKNGNFIKCWDSIKSAAEALNLSQTSIICVCDGKRRYKSTGGWIFKRENEVAHGN